MHPAPIKVTVAPEGASYVRTLASGERIYTDSTGAIYAVAPREPRFDASGIRD